MFNTLLQTCITILLNRTPYPYNKFDLLTLEHAKTRCAFYYKDAPCLKKFIKKEPKTYQAVCGE